MRPVILLSILLCIACSKPETTELKLFTTADAYYAPLEGVSDDSFRQALHQLIAQAHPIAYNRSAFLLQSTDSLGGDPEADILMVYTGHTLPRTAFGSGEGQWNREHVWAKSHGFPRANMPAYSDLHNLHPSEAHINRLRGDLGFGESAHASAVPGGNGTHIDKVHGIWQPPAERRGDIARTLIYLDIRYEGGRPRESDLRLVDELPRDVRAGMDLSGNGYFNGLVTLLRWHREDPVDEQEKIRNEAVFQLQRNRNPFIDHPEWVDRLYRKEKLNR